MYVSLMHSLSSGFRKWSDAHQPDHAPAGAPRGATPARIADPATIAAPPHQPWLVPGAGSSF